ncbi:MAG: oligosaccharide flippase family protein, partial [Bacteroidales bacterium]|nr:oligosaccharide flippase family protein [Bacteroidales bacterium]
MDNNQSSYRQILKATSIFGGVQVLNIIISIIRSKFVAVLLGPSGMGIIGLLNSTTSLINGLTSFGLGTSAVKDVAAANSLGNQTRIATVVTAFKRWVLMTGLLGTLVTFLLSPYLSQITFGNKDYTAAFAWIAITLLFVQLTSGQNVILQGMQKLKYLAQANLGGSILGLFVAVPLFYYFRIDAIVPVIILSSLFSLTVAWYFARKTKLVRIPLTVKNTVLEGKSMLMMGFMIGLSGLIGSATAYIVRIFISRQGGLQDVGFYAAGFAIINTYVGLVFNAMATDYYPRLSA